MNAPIRRAHLSLLGLGVVLYLWGFVGQTSLARLPDGFAARLTEFPVVFGSVTAGSYEEVRFLAEGYRPGDRVPVRFPSGANERITLRSAHSVPYLVLTLISGGLFLWISCVLFGPRADNPALRDLMWATWAYGLAVMLGGIYFPKTPWAPDLVRGLLQLSLLAALPVIFAHVSCVFPRPMRGHRHLTAGFAVLWASVPVLVWWQFSAFLGYFRDPGPETFSALRLPQGAADGMLVILVLLGLLVLAGRTLAERDPRTRSLLRGLLAGFALGVSPYVFLRTLPGLLGLGFRIPVAFDRLFELAIPVAVSFVVVRHRFLDIDVILRRRLLYTGLAGGLVSLGVGLVLLLGLGLDPALRSWHWLPVLGLGLVGGMLFGPFRAWIGRGIDHALFHIHPDTAATVGRLERDLDVAIDQTDLARTTAEFLEEVLEVERVAVVLRAGEDAVVFGVDADLVTPALSLVSGGEGAAEPGSTDSSRIESHGFPASLSEAGFRVAVPLETAPSAEGVILIGPRRSGRRLVRPDLAFVSAVAASLRLAVARMRLVQEAERAQIKDRFFSRVAHDLRTPLTSIGWTVRNLFDGLAGDLTGPQRDYLAGLRISAEYLERLVENLLEMGRLDRGQVSLDPVPQDLRPALETAAATVRPIAAARDIRVELHATGPVLAVTDHDKTVEIAVNLLENAVRYSPDGAVVRIATESAPPGFSVSDAGPGFPEGGTERLFSRFEQGVPSPHSGEQGFGLGLYIVASYVRLLGGTVSAANRPEGGACVAVRLPAAGVSVEES